MRDNVIEHDSIWSNIFIRVGFGFLLLFLTSQVSIPLKPVPITLQTLAIMIIGLKFERKDAVCAVLTYLLAGSLGLPVFANFGGGYQYIVGPTGGYLIGFLVAALVMSTISQKVKDQTAYAYTILNCSLGTAIIYLIGMGQLAVFIGFRQAVLSGLLPFIIPGIAKIALLTAGLHYLNK